MRNALKCPVLATISHYKFNLTFFRDFFILLDNNSSIILYTKGLKYLHDFPRGLVRSPKAKPAGYQIPKGKSTYSRGIYAIFISYTAYQELLGDISLFCLDEFSPMRNLLYNVCRF